MKKIRLKLTLFALAIFPIITYAQKEETRKIGEFSKVYSSGMFNVELVKGSEESLHITATNFPLDKIITEVQNGVLKIYREKGFRTFRMARVNIKVSYKNLSALKNSGSGNLICRSDIEASETEFKSSGSGSLSVSGNIKTENMEVGNSGSGSIRLNNIEAKMLRMSKSGSGAIKVSSGNVERQELSSTGSGDLVLTDVVSQYCRVKISGSGNAKVHATKQLNARTSGSGSIRYKGSPTIDSKTSGSGSIRSY